MSAHFIQHCDYESCDLGRFVYDCPACEKQCCDYEVWFQQDDILLRNQQVEFCCESCQTKLVAFWNDKDLEIRVQIRETP